MGFQIEIFSSGRIRYLGRLHFPIVQTLLGPLLEW
jgi:hypothetical protein